MNKILTFFLASALCTSSIQVAFSQTDLPCATDQINKKYFDEHPDLQAQILENEALANQHQDNGERALKVIPVVFHVLHAYGSENISNAQIINAMKILNQDYQKLAADTSSIIAAFKPIIGNVQFEFRLARKDPQGNCTNGIVRTFSTHTFLANDDAKDISPAWDRSKYINVWVVNRLENGAGGYTTFPGFSSAAYDGIILVNQQLGGIGTSGNSDLARRTLSHEMGHFFRLYHIWGSGNTPGVDCNGSDNVNDTPTTKGTTGQVCNTAQNTCGQVDNVQNIMDYSSCPKMFTVGQATRINNTITNQNQYSYRYNLYQAANLTATGTSDGYSDTICTPLADFNSYIRTVCKDGSIQFYDESWKGTPTTWAWTFTSGATVVTANTQDPLVTFPEAGVYNVSLTAGNADGSNTITKNSYIVVLNSSPDIAAPFVESFEASPIANNVWIKINDETHGWSESTNAAVTGTKSAVVSNNGAYVNTHSQLISPSYDFSFITSPKLKFKYAYAQKATDNSDVLKVYASYDCGLTWGLTPPIFSSNTLNTAGGTVSGNFIPTASQWKEATINMSSIYAGKPNVRFKFDFTAGGGNNLYIDDINITGTLGTKEDLKAEFDYSIYPNPAFDFINFTLNTEKSESLSFRVYDLLGKEVYTKSVLSGVGNLSYQIPVQNLSAGVYVLVTKIGVYSVSEKIIVSK